MHFVLRRRGQSGTNARFERKLYGPLRIAERLKFYRYRLFRSFRESFAEQSTSCSVDDNSR